MMFARSTAIIMLSYGLLATLGCSKTQSPDQLKELNRQLIQAVGHHDLDTTRRLLDKGANIETTSTDGNDTTLLGIAARDADLAMAKLLLQRGAKAHVKDHSLVTPLMHAAYGGHTEIVRVLLKQNPDQIEKNEALLEAAHGGSAVVIIEEPNKDHPGRDSISRERILSEASSPWVETVKLVLDSGADIEAKDEYRGPPLVDAAAYAQTDVVLLLLQKGANLHARDKYGNTALIAASCECAVATMNDAYDVVKVLLDRGSDVNARSNSGTTALMNAAGGFGGSAIVKLLLDHGADPRARDSEGRTALKYAMQENREDKVSLLKQALAKAHKR
jgi:ankyrin repeat protein